MSQIGQKLTKLWVFEDLKHPMTNLHNTNLVQTTIQDKIHNYCILEQDSWCKSQHSDTNMTQIGQKLTELWEFEDLAYLRCRSAYEILFKNIQK